MINSCSDLKAGDIFTWENYPLFDYEQRDRRWFLFLGFRALEAIVYQVTTTTKHEHYQGDGNRKGNNFFIINKGIGGLTCDSVVDLTRYFEEVQVKLFEDHKDNIDKKGSLNQDWINKLIKHIKLDKNIINIVKKDIYGYLRDAGFKVNS